MRRTATALLLLILFAPGVSAQTAPDVYSLNPEANELFLKAREYFNRSDPRVPDGKLSNAREAIRLYGRAVRKDPKFALAYVEMSRAWLQLGYSDPDRLSTREILPRARAALLKALALDKNSADVHRSLASLYYNVEYDWARAEREYRLAIRLAPGNAAARLGYAAYLGSMGRFDEALAEAKRADALAPSINADVTLARLYYSMRRHDDAAEYCRRSLRKGDNVLGHFYLGLVRAAEGRYGEAVAEFKAGAGFSNNGGALAGLAYGHALAGDRGEALRIIEELKTTYGGSRVVPYRLAAVYLALGDRDRAIEWLRRDYADRGNWMNQLKVDPVMDPLRSDPRFQRLMRLMRFKARQS